MLKWVVFKMLCPVNKYLVVKHVKEKKTSDDVTILLPEQLDANTSRFCVVEIVRSTINSSYDEGMKLVVPSHSVEKVDFLGQSHCIVLESHVIGFILEKK